MRLLVQSNSTSLYFCRGNQWTPLFKEAYDFGSLANLKEFSKQSDTVDLQAVIVLERSGTIDFMPFPLQRLLDTIAPAPSA